MKIVRRTPLFYELIVTKSSKQELLPKQHRIKTNTLFIIILLALGSRHDKTFKTKPIHYPLTSVI